MSLSKTVGGWAKELKNMQDFKGSAKTFHEKSEHGGFKPKDPVTRSISKAKQRMAKKMKSEKGWGNHLGKKMYVPSKEEEKEESRRDEAKHFYKKQEAEHKTYLDRISKMK